MGFLGFLVFSGIFRILGIFRIFGLLFDFGDFRMQWCNAMVGGNPCVGTLGKKRDRVGVGVGGGIPFSRSQDSGVYS